MIYHVREPELETTTHVSHKFWKGVFMALAIEAIAVSLLVWWWRAR